LRIHYGLHDMRERFRGQTEPILATILLLIAPGQSRRRCEARHRSPQAGALDARSRSHGLYSRCGAAAGTSMDIFTVLQQMARHVGPGRPAPLCRAKLQGRHHNQRVPTGQGWTSREGPASRPVFPAQADRAPTRSMPR
jgi:hypothetical protein